MTVSKHELKHDADMRWDSTYSMMNCFIELQLLVDYFLSLPNYHELERQKLSDHEWFVLGNYHAILNMLASAGPSNITVAWTILSSTSLQCEYVYAAKKTILDLMHKYCCQLPQKSHAAFQSSPIQDFGAIVA
ncbi:hypothetical protein OG21DRAFT_1527865 [Imleria badia]|nr:hypothetical protein OG21DRAFT_1527865 [Imleria badia]